MAVYCHVFEISADDFAVIDLVAAVDEALVAQVAEHEQLGKRAERHQRDELALVDV